MSYAFLTTWLLEAPRTAVWEALEDPLDWPRWWRGVESAQELAGGDERRVGARYRTRWRARLPLTVGFDFTVERIEPPVAMEGRAEGDLRGRGHWRLFEHDGVTAVLYEWTVEPTRAWERAVAPLARPAFRWNHDTVMRWGGEGLARRLGVALLASN